MSSVPKSKRKRSDLELSVKANELAAYTIRICSNENNFPKRYRWCITSKIVDTVIDVNRFIDLANAIHVEKRKDAKMRRKYQIKAQAHIRSLLTLMNIAYCLFDIDEKRIDYWTGMVVSIQTLLQNWKKSDKQRNIAKFGIKKQTKG